MAIPIGDDNQARRTIPVVTGLLIAANFVVFSLELVYGNPFVERWSFISSRFLADPGADWITVFSSMFMHAGWEHILGNMLFLFIFGDNVEDIFGHLKYLGFYLICGLVANFAQMAVDINSTVASLGASGAIAGVLAAYVFMFPTSRVRVLMGFWVIPLPAWTFIGFWIVIQIFNQVGSISDVSGGVAYMAHIGGFFSGLILTPLFRSLGRRQQQI
jgi:membrane associated rhomboid family serine protease